MTQEAQEIRIYGAMAEFDSTEHLLAGARKVRDAGFRDTDAFTPFQVHGLTDALGARKTRMAAVVLCAGLTGACVGLALQTWVSCTAYPHIVAGKPMFSWPNFMPIIFECMVLFAAFSGVLIMLGRDGLPRPYHPVFNVPHFDKASTDRFFLFIKHTDPKFSPEDTTKFLRGIEGVLNVELVRVDARGGAGPGGAE